MLKRFLLVALCVIGVGALVAPGLVQPVRANPGLLGPLSGSQYQAAPAPFPNRSTSIANSTYSCFSNS